MVIVAMMPPSPRVERVPSAAAKPCERRRHCRKSSTYGRFARSLGGFHRIRRYLCPRASRLGLEQGPVRCETY